MNVRTLCLPKDRTIAINGNAVTTLRIQKKWDVIRLASEARCSVKTIENIEKGGKRVYAATLEALATALDVDYQELLAAAVPDAASASQSRRSVRVVIELSRPFDGYDETDEFTSDMQNIRRLIAAQDEINVLAVYEGSVKIKLEMSYQDTLRLHTAFWTKRLAEPKIKSIQISDPGLHYEIRRAYERLHRSSMPESRRSRQRPAASRPPQPVTPPPTTGEARLKRAFRSIRHKLTELLAGTKENSDR
jgi:transcriptional regulator with XRE-family HTH domain